MAVSKTITDLTPATLPIAGVSEIAIQNGATVRKVEVKELPISDAVQGELDRLDGLDAENVKLTGDQTVAGVKTFSSSPVVPTPTTATQAANKSFVDSLMPSGVILPYGGSSAPSVAWLLCDGTAVSRTTYADLFAAIGTAYGVGDGSTTFNIPDMRGAAPGGAGTSTGYTANETLTLGTKHNDQMQQITGSIGSASQGVWINAGGSGDPDATAAGALTLSNRNNARASSGTVNGAYQVNINSANSPGARTGTTTRGKVVGVNFIIKV
jgi:microcystin-dependent protein